MLYLKALPYFQAIF